MNLFVLTSHSVRDSSSNNIWFDIIGVQRSASGSSLRRFGRFANFSRCSSTTAGFTRMHILKQEANVSAYNSLLQLGFSVHSISVHFIIAQVISNHTSLCASVPKSLMTMVCDGNTSKIDTESSNIKVTTEVT
jgi:hypothetical protein